MKLNKEECKFLRLGRNHPTHQYMLGSPRWEAAWQQRTEGSWWTPS